MDPALLRLLVREGVAVDAAIAREQSQTVLSGWRATLAAQWAVGRARRRRRDEAAGAEES
jgi:hypothetical protein